jgi:hypothetical protein
MLARQRSSRPELALVVNQLRRILDNGSNEVFKPSSSLLEIIPLEDGIS